MRIAITGATGFIGKAVARSLQEAGDEVIGLSRKAGPGRVRWSPQTGEADWEALGTIDAIIHLAGEPIFGRWTQAKRKAILDSRVDGTRLVGEIAQRLEVPTVLSGSAIGYYGDRGDQVLTESAGPGEGFLTEVVLRWEEEAAKIAERGSRVAMLRTGIVLHPSGGTLSRLVRIFKLGGGGRLGSGDQWMGWISLPDAVGAIASILRDGATSGPVNLTAPNPVRNREFTEALASALSRPAFLPAPEFALKAALGADLAEQLLLFSQRVVPEVLTSQGREFAHPTIQEAFAALL